jgi:hypothetical protein
MYGSTAVNFAANLIKSLRIAREQHDGQIIKAFNWSECVDDAVNYARMVNYPNHSRISNYSDGETWNNWIANKQTWNDVFKSLDNNNGYLLIYIDDNEEIKYCFWNCEQTENATYHNHPLDVIKYLSGYYPNLKEWVKVEPSPMDAAEYLRHNVSLFTDIKSGEDSTRKLVMPMRLEHYTGEVKKSLWCIAAKKEKGAMAKAKKQLKALIKDDAVNDFYVSVTPRYTWEGITYNKKTRGVR